MRSRWNALLLVGMLVGVGSRAVAGDEPGRVDNPMGSKPGNPEMIQKAVSALDELLGGLIQFSEKRQDLPPDAREQLNHLANRARELKPMLDHVHANAGMMNQPEGGVAPTPEMKDELRRVEDQMKDIEHGVHEMEQTKGEPTPEMKERMQNLRRRRAELQDAAERLREKFKAMTMQRPMGNAMMPRRIEGEIEVFRLAHADAQFVTDVLMQLLPPGSTVLPDKRTGKLLVITTPDGYGRTRRVVEELDEPSRDRPDKDRADMKKEAARRFDYERPDKPKVGRTVGKLTGVGDRGFAVRPDDGEKDVEFKLPMMEREGKDPAPREEFVKRLSEIKIGDRIVVEWREVEGRLVADGVGTPRDDKAADKPKGERTVGKLVSKGDDGFAVLPAGHEKPFEFIIPTFMRADQKPVPNDEFVKRLGKLEVGDFVVVEWNEIEGSRVAAGVLLAPDAKPREAKDKPSEGKDKPSERKDKPAEGKDKPTDGKDKPSEGKDKESTIVK